MYNGRRIVVVVPEWLDPSAPVIGGKMTQLAWLAERSAICRLSQLSSVETPEARWLGLRPDRAELRQGPLTVAALGADPPPRSLHFHLSLLGVDDAGIVVPPGFPPSDEESRLIVDLATKLNTRTITLVPGSGVDHGLVWEELGDMRTTPASEVAGSPMRERLPEGDRESTIRRYIDDSVNLLGEIEMNRRRVDGGVPPINLLWPWGHGERKPVPNLALMRAAPATVVSSSLRLAGLTRLAGYRHVDRAWLGTGLHTRLADAGRRSLTEQSSILVVDAIAEFRAAGMMEEAEFFSRQIDSELLALLAERAGDEPLRLLLVAPSEKGLGLTFAFDSKAVGSVSVPFDERALDDAKLPTVDVEDAIAEFLAPEV